MPIKKTPQTLLLADQQLPYSAQGWLSNYSLPNNKTPLWRYLHHKRWVYLWIDGGDWILGLAMIDLNYASKCFVYLAQKDQFANNLKSCVANDPDINVCLVKTLEDLRSLMPVGIPDLNLRPTEPFQINNLKFKTRPGLGIAIDSTFTDVRSFLT